jgi:hypothetical protein
MQMLRLYFGASGALSQIAGNSTMLLEQDFSLVSLNSH